MTTVVAAGATSAQRAFATTLGLDVIARAIAAAAFVVLIRNLDVRSFAAASVAVAVGQFLAHASTGGIRAAFIRDAAEERAESLHLNLGTAERALLLSGFWSVVICVPASLALAASGVVPSAGIGTGLGLAAYATFWTLTEYAIADRQASERFRAAGLVAIARSSTLLAFAVLSPVVTPSPAQTVGFLAATVAPTALLALIRWPTRMSMSIVLRRSEVWLSAHAAAAAAFVAIDLMVAGFMLADADVATLGAAWRYLAIGLAAAPALHAVMRVRTARSRLATSQADRRALALLWIRRTLAPAVLIGALLAAGAPSVIPLLDGGRYPESVVPFQLYVIVIVAAYVSALMPNLLLSALRYQRLAAIYSLALLANIALAVPLAATFGPAGVAGASGASYVLLAGLLIRETLRDD